MARDWENTKDVRQDILLRMGCHGPNIASVPFCETLENREGKQVWVVDLHVKVERKREFDITGEGSTLAEALRSAYLSLSREPIRS